MEKVLGIDHGDRRVGLSLSSEDKKYAFSFKTLENINQLELFKQIEAICEQENVSTVVIGLPLQNNGQVGPQAKKVQKFGHELEKFLSKTIIYEDERFTSAMATRLFQEAGKTAKQTKGTIDEKSAQLILQNYLDKNRD